MLMPGLPVSLPLPLQTLTFEATALIRQCSQTRALHRFRRRRQKKQKKKNEKDKGKNKKGEEKKEHKTTDNPTRSRSAQTRESETENEWSILRAAAPATVTNPPGHIVTAIPHCDRRPSAGDRDRKRVSKKKKSETADYPARSRSSRTSESEIEDDGRIRSPATQVDVLTLPEYFLRGYQDDPYIRDVIYKTKLVIGQSILPWYKHYMYVLTLSELTKLSVLPVRDSDGAFMVYPFAHGPTCGVMYVTANVGNPLSKYVTGSQDNSQNKETYEAIFPAAVCQLATIMSELNKCKIVPKRPLCVGDLWWNKVTKTVRLDLFNIAITNELELNGDNPFNVWGRPLLCGLARRCKMQKLVGDTIEKTICALQENKYSLGLIEHTTYMPAMLAEFRPQDPMGNTLGESWWSNVR